MRRRASALASLLPVLGLTGCLFFASPPDTRLRTTEEAAAVTALLDEAGVARWREAGRLMTAALEKQHPNPWFHLAKADFNHQVEVLDRDLSHLTERQAILRWKLIFAALGDEHTSLWELSSYIETWPIQVRALPSGLYVTAAGDGFQEFLGARVVKVSGQSIEAFMASVKPLINAAVPSHSTAVAARNFPYAWVWLKDLGRLPAGAPPTLEVAWPDGRTELRTIPTLASGRVRWTSLEPAAPLLRNVDSKRYYTHRLIEDGRTLYLRYRVCHNQPGEESVWAFTGRVQQETKKAPVERALVDLRGNGGGNSPLFWRMERWLRKHPAFSRPGGLLVLTDSGTFSSGFMAARNLQQAGGRVLGSEPGQPLNAYGQIRFTALPGLRPAFACSSKAFMYEPGNPAAWNRSLKVDIALDETPEDILGQTDSVLAAALRTAFPEK